MNKDSNKQELKKQAKAFILGLFMVLGITAVSAWTGAPSAGVSSNTPAPINVSSNPQAKGKTSPTSGSLLDINGVLSANALAVWGDTNISGDVTLSKFKPSTTSKLCVDSSGKVLLCTAGGSGTQQQTVTYTSAGNYTFTVPSGITTLTVELWGAGGAGFSDAHSNGVTTNSDSTDGNDTTFVFSGDTSKVNLNAKGGKTPTSRTSGGGGGSFSASGSLLSSSSGSASGSSGGSVTSSNQKYFCTVSSGNQNYPNYELWIGGDAGSGGNGGGTGGGIGSSSGSTTTDGAGNTLSSSSCGNNTILSNIANNIATNGTYFPYSHPTSNANDATSAGSGGGGAGGTSGKGAFANYTDSPSGLAYNSSTQTKGLCNDDNGSGVYSSHLCDPNMKGAGGGGAGGYVKAVLNVTAGQTYTMTVGSKGTADSFGTYWHCGGSAWCGIDSGSGADGQIMFSYN